MLFFTNIVYSESLNAVVLWSTRFVSDLQLIFLSNPQLFSPDIDYWHRPRLLYSLYVCFSQCRYARTSKFQILTTYSRIQRHWEKVMFLDYRVQVHSDIVPMVISAWRPSERQNALSWLEHCVVRIWQSIGSFEQHHWWVGTVKRGSRLPLRGSNGRCTEASLGNIGFSFN